MNLKLNNEPGSNCNFFRTHPKGPASYVKEERRRTGRYIAILVGISLLLLACYHAWVRRIPVVASLVVPALIMFVYVGWVLYSAARDKHRHMLLDAEAAKAAAENEMEVSTTDLSPNVEISVIPNRESTKPLPQETRSQTARVEISPTHRKSEHSKEEPVRQFVMPIILINDKPPDDLDDKSIQLDTGVNGDKLKQFATRRKFKRKFCRSRRYAVFKRSYSIA